MLNQNREKISPLKVVGRSWVEHSSVISSTLKRAIAHHAATHLLHFGTIMQVGSGTTLNEFMRAVLEKQKDLQTPHDIGVVTSNLCVVEIGLEAKIQFPELFGGLQIILTGGSLNVSLHSLVGAYAALGVREELIHPDIVVFGAAGINFERGDLRLTYQFQDELETQTAYATRPTKLRVLLCDHTKLGRTSGWATPTTVESLLAATSKVLIISTWPKSFSTDPEEIIVFEQQLQECERLVHGFADDLRFQSKDFALRFINENGEVMRELSFSAFRKRKGNSAKGRTNSARRERGGRLRRFLAT